jgi:hypothetical protein
MPAWLEAPTCTSCGEVKSREEFYAVAARVTSRRDSFCQPCKDCTKERARKHYSNTGGESYQRRKVDRSLMTRYGITLAERDAMFEAQGNVCAICGRSDRHGRGLAIDHDHATGKVRSGLCNRCNVAVGVLENPMRDQWAAYISKHDESR